jgi:hypothetical protein
LPLPAKLSFQKIDQTLRPIPRFFIFAADVFLVEVFFTDLDAVLGAFFAGRFDGVLVERESFLSAIDVAIYFQS